VTNKIYVVNANDVTVIDGATNTTSTILVGPTGGETVAVNSVTNKIYVALANDTVTVIDGATNTTITTLATGTGPYAMAVNTVTNRIYVTNLNSGNVTVIDGSTPPSPAVTLSCRKIVPAAGPSYLRCRVSDPQGIRRETVVALTTHVTESSVSLPCKPLLTTNTIRINDDGHAHRVTITDCNPVGRHAFMVGPDGTVTPAGG